MFTARRTQEILVGRALMAGRDRYRVVTDWGWCDARLKQHHNYVDRATLGSCKAPLWGCDVVCSDAENVMSALAVHTHPSVKGRQLWELADINVPELV